MSEGNFAINWSEPCCLIVTGASRGLGQTIAVEFSKKLREGSCVFLLARNESKLKITKDAVLKSTKVSAQIASVDLALLDSSAFELLLTENCQKVYDQVVLVHNAGTLGDISKFVANNASSTEIKQYFDLNLHSVMFLTSAFLKVFESSKRKLIINISSLAALQPFKGMGLYCTGKAARDMYFRVLADEDKSVRVLNYAPGPLLTDMLSQILVQAVPEIRQQFQDAQSQNQLLTCEYTTQKLIEVLDKGEFESGAHIDVFDV